MKTIFFSICLLFVCLSSYSQVISVQVKNIQNFEHPMMKTDDAILLDKVTYLGAGNVDVRFIFDLNEKKFSRLNEGKTDSLPIKSFKFIGDITEINVEYNKDLLVNYTISELNDKMMYCRWINEGKIRGWCDKNIEIKKEN
jgi:hypothetical protein